MAHLLRLDGTTSTLLDPTTMTEEHLTEPLHLEAWVIEHPEVLDPGLKVVTAQFASWASASDSASERLDVLALSSSGELVVVELKRASDRLVHLQAITYGALVSGFTRETLAREHASWLRRTRREDVSTEEALARLSDHVETEWSDDVLALPRLLLVAESFPAQVLTTVEWLSTVAPDLVIECHEYRLFRDGSGGVLASFQRLYPVDDLRDRWLRPHSQVASSEVREQIATNRRRAKSVTIISESGGIPEGARLTLELTGRVQPEVAEQVREWLAQDPQRADVRWSPHASRPLVWALEPGVRWTPSALRNRVFQLAGVPAPSFSAADAWSFEGDHLYAIASRVVAAGS